MNFLILKESVLMNNIKIEIQTRTSRKNGSEYDCLVITFPNGYERVLYFQNEADKILIKQGLKLASEGK